MKHSITTLSRANFNKYLQSRIKKFRKTNTEIADEIQHIYNVLNIYDITDNDNENSFPFGVKNNFINILSVHHSDYTDDETIEILSKIPLSITNKILTQSQVIPFINSIPDINDGVIIVTRNIGDKMTLNHIDTKFYGLINIIKISVTKNIFLHKNKSITFSDFERHINYTKRYTAIKNMTK